MLRLKAIAPQGEEKARAALGQVAEREQRLREAQAKARAAEENAQQRVM